MSVQNNVSVLASPEGPASPSSLFSSATPVSSPPPVASSAATTSAPVADGSANPTTHRMMGDLSMLDFTVKVPHKSKLDNSKPSAAALQRMDLELSQRMVEHLLDNLQPYLWTNKRAAMDAFEEYIFKQYPTLPEFLLADILIGRAGKGRGLMETIGGISWKTGWLRNSSVTAMNLLLRLLDPAQNPCKSFASVGCLLVFAPLLSTHVCACVTFSKFGQFVYSATSFWI